MGRVALAVLLLGTTSLGSAARLPLNVSVSLVRSETNASTLDYAVESRIYPEAPSLLVVTHRAAAPHASISVFDLSGGSGGNIASESCSAAATSSGVSCSSRRRRTSSPAGMRARR